MVLSMAHKFMVLIAQWPCSYILTADKSMP